jgi:hypothetical protein
VVRFAGERLAVLRRAVVRFAVVRRAPVDRLAVLRRAVVLREDFLRAGGISLLRLDDGDSEDLLFHTSDCKASAHYAASKRNLWRRQPSKRRASAK